MVVMAMPVPVGMLAESADTDAFEDEAIAESRVDGADLEHDLLNPVAFAPALDRVDVGVHPARHLDRAAEGDFAIALREVVVAHLLRTLQGAVAV